MFERTNEWYKLNLHSSIRYLYRDKLVDIKWGCDENWLTNEIYPTIDIYERRYFLWLIPYKKKVVSVIPRENCEETIESMKLLYSDLYEWWKFGNENTDDRR